MSMFSVVSFFLVTGFFSKVDEEEEDNMKFKLFSFHKQNKKKSSSSRNDGAATKLLNRIVAE